MVGVVNEILQNSSRIGDISLLIEDIAQQTTMLALMLLLKLHAQEKLVEDFQ